MAYVRKKSFKRGEATVEYYQLVESRRVDGKPRQRVLAHLGRYPSVDAALEELPHEIDYLRRGGFSSNAVAERKRKLTRLGELREQGTA